MWVNQNDFSFGIQGRLKLLVQQRDPGVRLRLNVPIRGFRPRCLLHPDTGAVYCGNEGEEEEDFKQFPKGMPLGLGHTI